MLAGLSTPQQDKELCERHWALHGVAFPNNLAGWVTYTNYASPRGSLGLYCTAFVDLWKFKGKSVLPKKKRGVTWRAKPACRTKARCRP